MFQVVQTASDLVVGGQSNFVFDVAMSTLICLLDLLFTWKIREWCMQREKGQMDSGSARSIRGLHRTSRTFCFEFPILWATNYMVRDGDAEVVKTQQNPSIPCQRPNALYLCCNLTLIVFPNVERG